MATAMKRLQLKFMHQQAPLLRHNPLKQKYEKCLPLSFKL